MPLLCLLFLLGISLTLSAPPTAITFAKGYLGDWVCVTMCFDQNNNWAPIPGGLALDATPLATDAPAHTVGCLQDIPNCLNGNWTLLVQNSTGNGYEVAYVINPADNQKIRDYVGTLTKPGNVPEIAISGYADTSYATPLFTLQSIGTAQTATSQIVEGYLADLFCVRMCFNESNGWAPIPGAVAVDNTVLSTNAEHHTVGCLSIPNCFNNGWTILETAVGGGYMVSYVFADDTPVKAFVQTLTGTYVPIVSVSGTVDNSYTPALLTATSISVAQVPEMSSTSGGSVMGVGIVGIVLAMLSLLLI